MADNNNNFPELIKKLPDFLEGRFEHDGFRLYNKSINKSLVIWRRPRRLSLKPTLYYGYIQDHNKPGNVIKYVTKAGLDTIVRNLRELKEKLYG